MIGTLNVEKVGLEAASMSAAPRLPPISLDLGIFLTVTSALKETRLFSAEDDWSSEAVSSERSESDRLTLARSALVGCW